MMFLCLLQRWRFKKYTVPLTHLMLIKPSPFGLICCFLVIRFKLHSWQDACVSDWFFSVNSSSCPIHFAPQDHKEWDFTSQIISLIWGGYWVLISIFQIQYWISVFYLWEQRWMWPTRESCHVICPRTLLGMCFWASQAFRKCAHSVWLVADQRWEPELLESELHPFSLVTCCLFLDFVAFSGLHARSSLLIFLRVKLTHANTCLATPGCWTSHTGCLSLPHRKPIGFLLGDSDTVGRLTLLLSTANSKRFADVSTLLLATSCFLYP